jgi:hypothetical protein
VTLYTRRQLLVLLLILAGAGSGLAIGQWRRHNPDLVAHMEQLDRAPAPVSSVAGPRSADRARPVASAAEAEPRRARRSRAPREPAAPGVADRPPTSETTDLDRITDRSAPCP